MNKIDVQIHWSVVDMERLLHGFNEFDVQVE